MNKTTKVVITVICLLAVLTVGFVNATPRPLKQVNMVYWTSLDPKELPVPGNQVSDFKLKLDGNPDSWYYLDIKFLKPTLDEMEDGWFLKRPLDQAFYDYWSSAPRYVTASSPPGTWQWIMWRIIRPTGGQFPMFILDSDGEGNYDLLDGLQYATFMLDPVHQPPAGPLRLNGDYPKGTYTFTSDLEIHDPADFVVEISIEFK